MAEQAKIGGATLQDKTVAVACKEDAAGVMVKLSEGVPAWVKADYVLNCEGVVGAIKRKLTGKKQPYIVTSQTFYQGSIDLDPHYFYAYLQPELSEYDAWFNVKDHLLVLGVSVKDSSKISFYQQRFLDYMRKQHQLKLIKKIKTERCLMPWIKPSCSIELGIGKVLFAGETAGFLNPMGEGISAAIESGAAAAHAMLAHWKKLPEIYKAYQHEVAALKAYMERQWRFVGHMANTFQEMR